SPGRTDSEIAPLVMAPLRSFAGNARSSAGSSTELFQSLGTKPLHVAVQRAYRSLSGIERPVRPASLEILEAFSNSSVNNGLGCESNPPFSDLSLKHITNINPSLPPKRVRKGYLILCLDF